MKTKILLLEDNPVHGGLLADELEDWGHEVARCTSTQQARDTIDGFEPDLLLLDLVIHNDHVAVPSWVRELRETPRWVNTPILVLTAYAFEFGDKVAKFSLVRVLGKPVEVSEVKTAVRELLSKRAR